jgi:ABC-type multidrug transport system fused ATPase/permease subunit
MRGIGAGMRIFEVLDRSPAIPYGIGEEVPKGQLGVVKFEHVHFEYPSRKGVEILKDFDLELGLGESVVIVYEFSFSLCWYMGLIFSGSGASGGGKSSVHSLLLRYYDPILGKITYDGKGLASFAKGSLDGSHITSQIFENSPQHPGVRSLVSFLKIQFCLVVQSLLT